MKSERFILLSMILILFLNAAYAQDYCLLRKPQYMSDTCPCYQFYLASTTGDAPRAVSDGSTCQVTDIGAREGWEVDPGFGGPHDWTSGDLAMSVVSPYYDDYYGCNDCRNEGLDGNKDNGSASLGYSKNYTKGALLAGPVSIPAESSSPTDVGITLELGKPYVIVGEGTCSLWDGQEDGCDSVYRYRTPLEPNGGELKVWGQLKLIDPTVHLSSIIEEQTGKSPEYNPSHVYEGVIFGEGKPLKAIVHDGGGYSDNHGELSVSVHEAIEK
jgi:hypothetical protein